MTEIFVVFDLETSSFDAKTGRILEIGALHISMQSLQVLSSFQIVAGMSREELDSLNVWEKHHETGLVSEIVGAPAPCGPADLDFWLSMWLSGIGGVQGDSKVVLCGNSIHFDRGFLEHQAPDAFAYLSHRVVDTSSLRTCYKNWVGDAPKADVKHRALGDCEMSLETLRWAKRIFQHGVPVPLVGDKEFVFTGDVQDLNALVGAPEAFPGATEILETAETL